MSHNFRSTAAIIIGLVGLLIATLSSVYFLIVLSSGFVNLGSIRIYITAVVVLLAWCINVALLRRRGKNWSVVLMVTSLTLSVLIIAPLVYAAIGP